MYSTPTREQVGHSCLVARYLLMHREQSRSGGGGGGEKTIMKGEDERAHLALYPSFNASHLMLFHNHTLSS